jgi:hypothetical protein
MSTTTLFGDPSKQMADLRELGRIARTLIAGGGADGRGFDLYKRLEGACVSAIDALRRDEVASFVVEIAAAATVVALAKDYAVTGFTARAFTLLLERPECAATAYRVALLGAGSQSRSSFRHTRGALHGMKEPQAVALGAAMDALADGSPEAAQDLFAVALANSAAPSILWLAEIAARAMGDGARFQKTRRALDDLLESDAFGSGAQDAASFMRLGRERLDALGSPLVHAWKAAAEGGAYELTRPLDEAAHYAITGFRELYGLEILREALPELTTLLRVGRSEAN